MPSIDLTLAVRIKPVNKPTDKVIFKIGNTEISKSAHDVVRDLLGPLFAGNAQVALAAPAATGDAVLPKIGAEWNGGIYAGLSIYNNAPVALVLLPGDEKLDWKAAGVWTEKQGGVLPSRFDHLVLFQNLRGQFKEEAYWSATPYAGDESYAWFQLFFNGHQFTTHKGNQLRARAVRRVKI